VYLFVFVGLAWLLTAPMMGVLIGKVVATADRRARNESAFDFLEADLRGGAQPTTARS
jgi:multisubunit Na+/H+ antiporter MnhG subunit